MENPVKFMDVREKDLVQTLHEAGGIGTVVTRADIIEKLIDGQYMELRGKYLHVTPTGKQLLDLAPEALRSPKLTAEWEQKLMAIERRSEEHTSELQSRGHLVCRLLLEKKKAHNSQ